MRHTPAVGLRGSRLLAALPRQPFERLRPQMRLAQFPKGRIIYDVGDEAHDAYFPLGGMLSLLSLAGDGSTVEVAMVGIEGMAGIPLILRGGRMPFRVMAQFQTHALALGARAFRAEFARGEQFHDLMLRYAHTLVTQVAQSAVCNRFHSVEERLCRWLLITRDRVGADTFLLTQEFISQMIGAPRTAVTMTAGRVQRRGLISYRRGRITILDTRGLEAAACECYRVVTREIEQLLAA
ncbi:MAG TPA: Crp/Fnr family transcriptional regulator [Pyrinomonadaceae bacterium]|nr:Crp/Fnr family transcriptional regulator [Pyrinomonadaceae bacterium]